MQHKKTTATWVWVSDGPSSTAHLHGVCDSCQCMQTHVSIHSRWEKKWPLLTDQPCTIDKRTNEWMDQWNVRCGDERMMIMSDRTPTRCVWWLSMHANTCIDTFASKKKMANIDKRSIDCTIEQTNQQMNGRIVDWLNGGLPSWVEWTRSSRTYKHNTKYDIHCRSF
jgi:hypothetical protein